MKEYKLVVDFEFPEVCEILRIIIDQDKDAALEFIRKHFKKRLDDLEFAH